ncbi:MAG: DUF3237 domain-containing protein [Acidimicrobiia bacterium]
MTIELIPLCTIRITLTDPTLLGATPAGTRAIAEVGEAVFEGERLRGRVLSPSADWVTVSAEGIASPDVRMHVETYDGAHVYVWYHGRSDFSQGIGVAPLYTAPLFETGDERYAWLNRIQGVGKGVLDGNTLVYEVYEVQ